MFCLRAGYRTDTIQGLSPLAGLTTGVGILAWGQELAYAWVPMGELGNTQYFSLVVRFGEAQRALRNLIHFGHHVPGQSNDSWAEEERKQLIELIDYDSPHLAKQPAKAESAQ